jgi:hypothetical protein
VNIKELINLIYLRYRNYLPYWDRDVAPFLEQYDLDQYNIAPYKGRRRFSELRLYFDDIVSNRTKFVVSLYPQLNCWKVFDQDPASSYRLNWLDLMTNYLG